MQRLIRTVFVCLLVALITFQPVVACHNCGGWSGGYYAPTYYGSYGGGCCGGYYETVEYDCCGGCHSCEKHPGAMTGGPRDEAEEAPEGGASATEAAPSTEPMTTPATQPAAESAPQLPSPPAATEAPMTEPAQPAESLFGTEQPAAAPPATTPVETPPPAAPPAAPAEAAPATPPQADPGELFGAPAPATPPPADPSAPATTPPATTPPAETTPPSKSPADELFGPTTDTETKSDTTTTANKPVEQPATPEAKPAEKAADQPAVTPAAAPAGEEKKPEEKKAEEVDPLFGTSQSVLHEAGGLASNETRLWTDNTGNFSCNGRMLQFRNGHVRLVKANGRTTTVPLARLSVRDLEFVNRQASAQQAEIGKTAQAPAAMPALAN